MAGEGPVGLYKWMLAGLCCYGCGPSPWSCSKAVSFSWADMGHWEVGDTAASASPANVNLGISSSKAGQFNAPWTST